MTVRCSGSQFAALEVTKEVVACGLPPMVRMQGLVAKRKLSPGF